MNKHYLYLSMLLTWMLSPNARSQTTSGIVSYNESGEYQYTVPACGTFTLTARGADGASSRNSGGSGASLTASFPLLKDDVLLLVIGHEGRGEWASNNSGGGGGGGGTGVVLIRGGVRTLLLIASGGGGGGFANDENHGRGKGASAADGTIRGGSTSGGGGGGGYAVSGGGNKGGGAGRLSGGASGGAGTNSDTGGSLQGGFGFGGGGAGSYGNGYGGGGGGGYEGGDAGNGYAGGQGGASFVQTGGAAPASNVSRQNGSDGGGDFVRGSVQIFFVQTADCPDDNKAYATSGEYLYPVPGCGTVTLTARGADGATSINQGGSGATLTADFSVQKGDTLFFVVGHEGNGQYISNQGGSSGAGSGGGGTGVVLIHNGQRNLLLVAAGGGGSGFSDDNNYGTGKGASADDGTAQGGTSPQAGGGGGFNANGAGSKGGKAGTLTGGGEGGTGSNSSPGASFTFRGGFGFGGGGAGNYRSGNPTSTGGGGGGGYGGGSGGQNFSGGQGGVSFVQTSASHVARQNGIDGGGDFVRGSIQFTLKLDAVQPPTLSTASPGDDRVPAGQQSASVCQNSGPVVFQFSGCEGGTVNWTGSDNSSGTGNVAASTATVGTVTYSATCTKNNVISCSSNTVSVTTTAAPIVAISGNLSVFYGYGSNCTTLTASPQGTGPFTYQWHTGQTNLGTAPSLQVCPGQTSQLYTVTVTDAKGCTISQTVTVTVNDVRCGYGGVKVCQGGRELCIAQYLVPTYLRFGATLGGCNANVPARLSYEQAQEVPFSLALKAYPNPVSDVLTVEVLAPTAGTATFEVLDLLGRAVQTRKQELMEGLNIVEFRLGILPSGTYLIRAMDALNRQATVPISKQ